MVYESLMVLFGGGGAGWAALWGSTLEDAGMGHKSKPASVGERGYNAALTELAPLSLAWGQQSQIFLGPVFPALSKHRIRNPVSTSK